MMRIVYFVDHLRPDGTQFVLRQLVEGMAARGHYQMVICLNDSWDEAVLENVQNTADQVRVVGKIPLLSGIGLLSIWRCLKYSEFDVAVTLLFASDVIGRVLARLANIPRIVTSIQTHDEYYSKFQRWLVRRTMPLADVVLINSKHYIDFVVTEEGANPDKIQVIYNGIHLADYNGPNTHSSLIDELGLHPDSILLGSVGRLTYQKGYDVLIQSLKILERDDIHLVVAGFGEELDNLQEQATCLGLQEQVHLLGFRQDVPRLLCGIDIYVQSSRYEGMPIAVLEAMASRCPIVATAVDGTQELLIDGQHGWLVPPDDPQALAEVILMALSDPVEADRRGRAAQKLAFNHFNINNLMVEWENAFAEP